MDMISIGAEIDGAHSVTEKVLIGSCSRTLRFVKQILKDLSE